MRSRFAARAPGVVVAASLLLAAVASSAGADPTPVNVPVTSADPAAAYQAPWLAVDPVDPRKLAVSFQDPVGISTDCWLGLSSDGGATWTQVNLVGAAGQGAVLTLPSGFVRCFRDSFTYGPDGTLYYAYTAGQPGFPGYNLVFVTASTDGGKTFGTPVPVDDQPLPNAGNVNDQIPRLATDPHTGRLYVAWQQVTGKFASSDIRVAASADRGQTFSSPVRVSVAGFSGGPQLPSVGPDGRVYVAFQGNPTPASMPLDPSQPENVEVTSSSDGGATFGVPVTAQREFNCQAHGPQMCASTISVNLSSNSPELVAGPARGDAFLVSYGLESNIFRLRFSVSHDAGITWGPERTIGIPAGSDANDQVLPTIALAPSGRIDVVYYDLSPVTAIENTYLISSGDGGATFSAPMLLSSAPSNTTIAPSAGFGNSPFPGSQLVASTDDATYAAWTDSRRAVAPTEEDIFFAAVFHPPSISSASESATAWRRNERLAHFSSGRRREPPLGTSFAFTLNEPATVTLTFTGKRSGRRAGSSCVPETARNRRHAKCTRPTGGGSLAFAAHPGVDRIAFGGRISRSRRLTPGRYTVVLVAVNSHGQRSVPRSLRFTIIG